MILEKMSENVESSGPLSEGEVASVSGDGVAPGDEAPGDESEPTTPKPAPMAFTVDFGNAKQVDQIRLEELAKKSHARHKRVQSMSAGLMRPAPVALMPPLSVKLPRKAQGYNSEGYFSSDQEDSTLSGSIKLRNSSSAQNMATSYPSNRHSPINDYQPHRMSKSPIVDRIMSRSDNFTSYTSRQGLNLPLSQPNGSYLRDVKRTPSYGNLAYQPRVMEDIPDNSPDGAMLIDISSPELDILTPDNGHITPGGRSPLKERMGCATPDLLHQQPLPDDEDRQSTSSTGTYTIETHHPEHTETQLLHSTSQDSQLVFDLPNNALNRDLRRRSALTLNATYDMHNSDHQSYDIPFPKHQKDKNILEISCSYESPTDDLAAQTSKQIKSTRNYLEKIKSRVRTITEKTFTKPVRAVEDVGSFTSVTTSGVLSSRGSSALVRSPPRRRCSLAQSEVDQTDYVHRLSRESSVPVCLAVEPSPLVISLSHMNLTRCKGDTTWIQDWAESVKKYNSNVLSPDATYIVDPGTDAIYDRPPASPRLHASPRPRTPVSGSPCKIPSPRDTLMRRRTPDLIPSQDTEAYLLNTQNAITNLQANLQAHRNAKQRETATPPLAPRLPVSQLSRSNSLNYRLRRQETDNSPLRSPATYTIMGSGRQQQTVASRRRDCNWNMGGRTPRIEPTRCPATNRIPRSSSCQLVNNNNKNHPTNYLTDESDTEYEGDRYKRLRRGRIDSPAVRSVPANSPRTPELSRKFTRGSLRMDPPRSARPTRNPAAAKRTTAPVVTKQAEFTNWKRRASYDPMKAALEGRKKQQAKRQDKDELSSSSLSSPVARSQSFHTTLGDLTLQCSSGGSEDELTLSADPMTTSTQSDILHLRPRQRIAAKQPLTTRMQYVSTPQRVQYTPAPQKTKQQTVVQRRQAPSHLEQRKAMTSRAATNEDKGNTFTVNSDTNSGSSPRNSSIFSHEKASLTTCTSDTESHSGESARGGHATSRRAASAPTAHRNSGVDMSSRRSTGPVQPRYLDISRHRAAPRDLNRRESAAAPRLSKGSAAHIEMEQKKQELEKWRRRATYDPRAAARAQKPQAHNSYAGGGSVLRSQSFNGPLCHPPGPRNAARGLPSPLALRDDGSDNDF